MSDTPRPSPWVVHKFGGTSLADAQRFRGAARLLLADSSAPRKAVVVSAMAGVTDALLQLLAHARQGREWRQDLQLLEERHRGVIEELVPVARRPALTATLRDAARELHHLLGTVSLLRMVPDPVRDLVAGFGELWSAPLFAAHLNSPWVHREGGREEEGEDATWLDAREVLVVEHAETGPRVDWQLSRQRLDAWLAEHEHHLVVVTGFIARLPEGTPTTLKRNGSDFTASIFGSLLAAREIVIWTDVDGVLSADPRRVPEAFPVPHLSYDEAMELAYFGARVLHPSTMAPAVADGIPLRILNSHRPGAPGTTIGPAPARVASPLTPSRAVRGFSTVDEVALINLEGSGMIGVPGIAERLFGALSRVGVSVIMISQASSEHSICLAVPEAQGETARRVLREAFFAELHHGQIQRVELTGDCTLLAAVGDAMSHTPGVAACFFGALAAAGVNVRAIAQGASERNVTVVVDRQDSVAALRAVHAGFFPAARPHRPREPSAGSVAWVTARAPASIGNVGVGFDVLGLAAPVAHDRVTVRRLGDGDCRIVVEEITGPGAAALPRQAERNTAAVALAALVRQRQLPHGFRLQIEKGIPLAAGMGGSAASAAAAVVAAARLLGDSLSREELFRFAVEGEAAASGGRHGDNVAPSLFGGLALVISHEEGEVVDLPLPPGLWTSLVHPHLEVETRAARGVLEPEVPLAAHSRQTALLAGFVTACLRGDMTLLGRTLVDALIEPQRAGLIPGFAAAKRGALGAGALGFSISGAGPSVFALAPGREVAERVSAAVAAAFRDEGLTCDAWSLPAGGPGAEVVAEG